MKQRNLFAVLMAVIMATAFIASPSEAQFATPISTFNLSTACSTPTSAHTCSSTSVKIIPLFGYAAWSLEVGTTHGNTISWYVSNGGTTWTPTNAANLSGSSISPVNYTNTAGRFEGAVGASQYLAIIDTVVGSSAVTITSYLSTTPAITNVLLGGGGGSGGGGGTYTAPPLQNVHNDGSFSSPGPTDSGGNPYVHVTFAPTALPTNADGGSPAHITNTSLNVTCSGCGGSGGSPGPTDSAGIPYSHPTYQPTTTPYTAPPNQIVAPSPGATWIVHNDGSFGTGSGSGSSGAIVTPTPLYNTFPSSQSVISALFGWDSVTPAWRGISVDTSGNLILSTSSPFFVTLSGSNTVTANIGSGMGSATGVGTPGPYALTVQGNSSGIPFNVTGTIACSNCSGSAASPYPTSSPGGILEATLVTASGAPYVAPTSPPYVAPTCSAAPNAPCVQITGTPSFTVSGTANVSVTNSPTVANTSFGLSAVTGNGATILAPLANLNSTAQCSATSAKTLLTVMFENTQTSITTFVDVYDSATVGGVTIGTNSKGEAMVPAGFSGYIPISPVGIKFSNGVCFVATTTTQLTGSSWTGSANGVELSAISAI